MSFFVIDDDAPNHPKHRALIDRGLDGDLKALAAGYLWTVMGAYLRGAFIDGVVTRRDLWRVMPGPVVEELPAYLVEVGLWHDSQSCCERCQRPCQGEWVYHDWAQWSQRTGDQDRARRALQTERRDQGLHDAMWERDALPPASDGRQHARCVYCQRAVYRDARRGDLAPEMDHVYGRALGLDGVAISCRQCNRGKGNRSASAAGLRFHPTPAHAAALARRESEHGSRQAMADDLLELTYATDPAHEPDTYDVDRRSRTQEEDAEPAAAVDRAPSWADAEPVDVGRWSPPPPSVGHGPVYAPARPGPGASAGDVDGCHRPARRAGGSSVPISPTEPPPQAPWGLWAGPTPPQASPGPSPAASAASAGLEPVDDVDELPAALEAGPSRACARTGPCAPVRAAAGALSRPSGQGKAGQGQEEEGQDEARQGQVRAGAGPGRRKRGRRRRGRGGQTGSEETRR